LNLNNKSYYNFIDKKTIPLVFIHGVGLDHNMWSPQINYFKNYSTITYDLLGHGRTPFKKEKINMQDYIEQLLSIIEFLKVEKINLVGFSIGSLIALNFATDFQKKLNSLTLIATTYKRTEEQRQAVIDRVNLAKLNKPISQLAMKRWFTDEYLKKNPIIYDKFTKILTKNGEDQKNFIKAYELFAHYKDDLEKIKKINTKTLVMTGSIDPGSTPEMSKKLSNDLNNSIYTEINNGKHLCSIECADDVNINIKKFIENA
jgi:pimeloyl-ACP methyl ester carboxylesterase